MFVQASAVFLHSITQVMFVSVHQREDFPCSVFFYFNSLYTPALFLIHLAKCCKYNDVNGDLKFMSTSLCVFVDIA